jgi:Flp pilus assembly pilin Flp
MCQAGVKRVLRNCSGESIVECVFVCALIAIIVISVLAHTGQRSRARLTDVNGALKDPNMPTVVSPAKK